MPIDSLTGLAEALFGPEAAAVPRVLRQGAPVLFREFTLDRVERILAEGNLRPPQVCLVRDGSSLPPAGLLRKIHYPYPGSPATETLDFGRVARAFRDGYTIKLIGCDRFLPELTAVTNGLRAFLGHPVLAVMFITPPGEKGLDIHADGFDAFIVQVQGQKEWEVFDRLPGGLPPGFIDRARAGDPRLSAVLEPGDVLALPYGCPHLARARTLSVHISIGARTFTIRDLLAVLLTRSAGLPAEIERTIPFAPWPPGKLREALEPAWQALVAHLETLSWDELLAQAAGPLLPAWQPGTLAD